MERRKQRVGKTEKLSVAGPVRAPVAKADEPIPYRLGRRADLLIVDDPIPYLPRPDANSCFAGLLDKVMDQVPRAFSTPPGTKYDGQKPRHSLIPVEATDALLAVLEFGAKKYAPDNWQHVPNPQQRYTDALERHLDAIKRGERIDAESGQPHIAQVLANAVFLTWFDAKAAKREEKAKRKRAVKQVCRG